MSAGIEHTGDPEPVQLMQKPARSFHAFRKRGRREPRVQTRDRGTVAADPAVRLRIVRMIELRAGRQVALTLNAEGLQPQGRQQDGAIE